MCRAFNYKITNFLPGKCNETCLNCHDIETLQFFWHSSACREFTEFFAGGTMLKIYTGLHFTRWRCLVALSNSFRDRPIWMEESFSSQKGLYCMGSLVSHGQGWFSVWCKLF